jgi:hypothetical protein
LDTRTRPHAAAKSQMAAALLFAKPLPLAAAIEPEHAGGLPAQPGFYAWWIERGTIPGVPHHPHPTRSLLGLLYVGIRPTRTREAVEHGISAIGRVVVAAALIMGTVLAAFILSADRIPKEFGLLLAVAILTDALIVRMTLVPAFLTLLREKSWYIPRWLDRLLPNLTIEPPLDGQAPRASDFAPSPSGVTGRTQPKPSEA